MPLICKTLFVDIANGNDLTAIRGTDAPFQGLEAARDAAMSGDTIIVRPGDYSVSSSLAKAGVSWDFFPSSVVTYDVTDDFSHIFDFNENASYQVLGRGKFLKILSSTDVDPITNPDLGGINVSDGNVFFECESIQVLIQGGGDIFSGSCVSQSGGTLFFKADKLIGDSEHVGMINYGVWWTGGNGSASVGRTDLVGWSVGSSVDGSDSNVNFYYNSDEVGQGVNGAYGVVSFGTDPSAALWVRCGTVMGDYVDHAIQIVGVNKLYVTAQKIFGMIISAPGAGLWYVSADKISLTDSSASGFSGEGWVACEGGSGFLSIKHWNSPELNPNTKLITMDGGSLVVDGGFMQATSNVGGVTNTAGTVRLNGVRIDTAANSGTSPITKAGGTVIIDNVVLVANTSCDSVTSTTAQNVIVYGGVSNKAVHANIAQQVGSLTISSTVI